MSAQTNTKLTSVILAAALSALVAGCAGHHAHGGMGLTAEQAQNWKDANVQFKSCNKIWWEQEVTDAPQWKQLVTGNNDSQYLQKMTSKAPVSKALKDSLVKYRPQQIACRKALFDALGDSNPAVKMMYQKNFNDLDQGIVKIVDGKVKTMGELNQAYVVYNNNAIERKTRLMLHDPRN